MGCGGLMCCLSRVQEERGGGWRRLSESWFGLELACGLLGAGAGVVRDAT